MAGILHISKNDQIFLTLQDLYKHKHSPVGDNMRVNKTILNLKTLDFGLVGRVSTAQSHSYYKIG